MRPTPNLRAERHRIQPDGWPRSASGENCGAFLVPTARGHLKIIASDGLDPESEGWEHVSVSLSSRCPTWGEMQQVKELFWSGEETVVQFHPRAKAHVTYHPFCLHLWRRIGEEYELPPRKLITP